MKFTFKLGGKRKQELEQRMACANVEENSSNSAFSMSFGEIFGGSTSRNLSAVYRATELISDAVAMLPIKVRKKNGYHSEDLPNHPIHFLFNNMIMTKFMFIKKLVEDVILNGNGYAYIVRGSDGTPIALRYLTKGEVTVNYRKESQTVTYKISNTNVAKGAIPASDMIHLIKNTTDGVNGISILSYAKRSVNLANATENSASKYFSNGRNLAGIIKSNRVLSDEQKRQIKQAWVQNFAEGGDGVVVFGNDSDYTPVSQNAADSQMLQTREYNTLDIARFFGINPILLGDLSKASYNTLELIQQDFVLHTLNPYILMIEEEFTRKLLGDDLKINLDENYLLRIDKSTQASYYQTMLTNGVLCINEVRNDMGLSPIEGGDVHTIAYSDVSQNTINKPKEENNTEE